MSGCPTSRRDLALRPESRTPYLRMVRESGGILLRLSTCARIRLAPFIEFAYGLTTLAWKRGWCCMNTSLQSAAIRDVSSVPMGHEAATIEALA
jgi:hypothetical protein